MTEKVSKSLDEKYYVIDHKSGLKIYVMPKENYSSTYAKLNNDSAGLIRMKWTWSPRSWGFR